MDARAAPVHEFEVRFSPLAALLAAASVGVASCGGGSSSEPADAAADGANAATDAPLGVAEVGVGEAGDTGEEAAASDAADASNTSDATAVGDATDAADAADASGSDSSEPDVDTIPWSTGVSVGYGVAAKDTQNPIGSNAAIIYAGYGATLSGAEAWATALFRATLHDKGVRWLWAVQGPADIQYSGKEIGNSKIAAALLASVSASTHFVLVVGHSSGSYVAHELLGELSGGLDPSGLTRAKTVYFDLDGALGGLTSTSVAWLRKAYFVGAWDADVSTASPNDASMRSGGTTWAPTSAYYQVSANGSGCLAGAIWCLHMTVVTTLPHDPAAADVALDYSDFVGRPVAHDYIEASATAAGLAP